MTDLISKKLTDLDSAQVLESVYNDSDATLSVSGFITNKLGNKIIISALDSLNDKLDYRADGNIIYSLKVTYNNGTHDSVTAVERIA